MTENIQLFSLALSLNWLQLQSLANPTQQKKLTRSAEQVLVVSVKGLALPQLLAHNEAVIFTDRSLQPSGSFRLHPSNAPSDAEGPAPPARLPEVAGPKLGAGLRALRAVLGSSLPARGFGEETVSGLGPHVHVRGAEQDPLTMARPQPLALQLEQLLNPRPREADRSTDDVKEAIIQVMISMI